jgi:hypothetical protein
MLSSKTSDSSRISNSGRIAFEQTFIVLEFCRRRFLRMFVRALTMAMVVVVGGVVVVVVPVVMHAAGAASPAQPLVAP